MNFYMLPLDYFNFDGDKPFSLLLSGQDMLSISKDDALGNHFGDIIHNLDMVGTFGLNVMERIYNGNYSFAIENLETSQPLQYHNEYLHALFSAAQTYCTALWFVKDNAVNIPFGIFIDLKNNSHLNVTKNIMYSTAIGDYVDSFFDNEEINEAQMWIDKIIQYLLVDETDERNYDLGYSNLSKDINFNTGSFTKALLFLQQARNTSFLPSKIASYISILETLFCVSSANNYKTPQRAAVFLGGQASVRKGNFNLLKDAYGIRSNFVHGSHIGEKSYRAIDYISNELDIIVRNVLKKMFDEHTELNYNGSDTKKINSYFDELVLGGD